MVFIATLPIKPASVYHGNFFQVGFPKLRCETSILRSQIQISNNDRDVSPIATQFNAKVAT